MNRFDYNHYYDLMSSNQKSEALAYYKSFPLTYYRDKFSRKVKRLKRKTSERLNDVHFSASSKNGANILMIGNNRDIALFSVKLLGKTIFFGHWYKSDLRRFKSRCLNNLRIWLDYRTQYAIFSGRDCDCVSYSYPVKASSYRALYAEFLEASSDIEGPQGFSFITKAEYQQAEPQSQDHILEAFENGDGCKVII